MVVVSVNHRLNTFGFLGSVRLRGEVPVFRHVGMLDIVDALEWIQENIAAFGGDPDNVTVFGQSGGGAKVLTLMTSPYAQGLFDKGIVQSGATETMGVVFNSQEASTALDRKYPGHSGDHRRTYRGHPDCPLWMNYRRRPPRLFSRPARSCSSRSFGRRLLHGLGAGGGRGLPAHRPGDGGLLCGSGPGHSLLIGSNLNEWSGFFAADPIQETPELAAALQAAYPNKPGLTADQVDSTTIRLPLLKIMSHKADQAAHRYTPICSRTETSYHTARSPMYLTT